MQRKGLKINIVRDDGAASQAGLAAGDIIIRHGSHDIASAEDLTAAIAAAHGNVKIVFIRNSIAVSSTLPPGPMGISFSVTDIAHDELEPPKDYETTFGAGRAAHEAQQLGEMIVTTAPMVDGFRIVLQRGIITAECVFGLNLLKDLGASFTDTLGGRSASTQNALRDARETCLVELKREALSRGANAIIGVDLDYSEFSGQGKSMLLIVASGTAVVIARID